MAMVAVAGAGRLFRPSMATPPEDSGERVPAITDVIARPGVEITLAVAKASIVEGNSALDDSPRGQRSPAPSPLGRRAMPAVPR